MGISRKFHKYGRNNAPKNDKNGKNKKILIKTEKRLDLLQKMWYNSKVLKASICNECNK